MMLVRAPKCSPGFCKILDHCGDGGGGGRICVLMLFMRLFPFLPKKCVWQCVNECLFAGAGKGRAIRTIAPELLECLFRVSQLG